MKTFVSGQADVVSWSKDSILIRWRFADEQGVELNGESIGSRSPAKSASPTYLSPSPSVNSMVRGYCVRYQAVGSSVVQYSQLLNPSTFEYQITQLHENTNYEICIIRVHGHQLAKLQPSSHGPLMMLDARSRATPTTGETSGTSLIQTTVCIKGTTSTDSLSVALGSTFGAFLALGFIVALVFIAKWQHSRRMTKRVATDAVDSGTDFFDGVEMTECVQNLKQSTGAWNDDSTTTDATFFPEAYDISTTTSRDRRRSSSAIDSDVHNASRPISPTPPPLFDPVSATRVLDDYSPYYGRHHSRAASHNGSSDPVAFETMSRISGEYAGMRDDLLANHDEYRFRREHIGIATNFCNDEHPLTLTAPVYYYEGASRLASRSEGIGISTSAEGYRSVVDSENDTVDNGDEGDQPCRLMYDHIHRHYDIQSRKAENAHQDRSIVELYIDVGSRSSRTIEQRQFQGQSVPPENLESLTELTGSSAGGVAGGLGRNVANKNRLMRQSQVHHEGCQVSYPPRRRSKRDHARRRYVSRALYWSTHISYMIESKYA